MIKFIPAVRFGITAAIAAASLTLTGCDNPSYEGGCIVRPTDDQHQSVKAYLDQNRNRSDVIAFITSGREVSVCYANHDPSESTRKRRDPARTDLNFPATWENDVDAAIAGYAIANMPDNMGDLGKVARIVTLEIRDGHSFFPTQVERQMREVHDQRVELEGTPPAEQDFKGGVISR